MANTTYGYVRVSTKEQNEARQMIAMHEFGVDELLQRKQKGFILAQDLRKSLLDIKCAMKNGNVERYLHELRLSN